MTQVCACAQQRRYLKAYMLNDPRFTIATPFTLVLYRIAHQQKLSKLSRQVQTSDLSSIQTPDSFKDQSDVAHSSTLVDIHMSACYVQ